MRTLEWDFGSNCLRLIDQRRLPAELCFVTCDRADHVAAAIRDMVVRGAPAIGVTAAFGLALAALHSPAQDLNGLKNDIQKAAHVLRASRPTAVNLAWALDRVLGVVAPFWGSPADLRSLVLAEAQVMADEDVAINQRMARHGVELIDDGDLIIHHCNTGALAAVDWGTALGVIRMAHILGKHIHVLVDETRPRLQGARLTAWELEQYGIPYDIISDNAAGFFLHSGQVKKVFVGADRVAANGDVVNKVGTYMLALAAHDNGVPFYSVFPTSTIDLSLPAGENIPIEERETGEVLNLEINGVSVFPSAAKARNPAFDLTPQRLITALVTENGILYPPFTEKLAEVVSRPVS